MLEEVVSVAVRNVPILGIHVYTTVGLSGGTVPTGFRAQQKGDVFFFVGRARGYVL